MEHGLEYITFYVQKHEAHLAGSRRITRGARIFFVLFTATQDLIQRGSFERKDLDLNHKIYSHNTIELTYMYVACT